MKGTRSRRSVLRALGAGAGVGLTGCLGGGSSPEEEARSHRETLSQYSDVAVAAEDGYEMSTPYLRSERGVLGMPFVNYDGPERDPERPNMLFYNLREDGTFELLGAKWFVSTEEADGTPSMFGREFDGPFEGRARFVPEHYGLYAWLFEDNPEGLFAEVHTGVEAPDYVDDLETAWAALEPYSANITLAEDEGYANAEVCTATADGGYGIPVVDTEATGTDPSEPAVLIYRFASNWSYHLIGAEWYVSADETGSPPSMFGQEFHESTAGHGEESDQPDHYGLHAWLFTANPNGLFAPYNPLIECANQPEDA